MLETIVIHDARPEHADAMLAFMRRVEEAVAGAPGLLEISSHRDTMSGRLVAIARWESQEAFTAAMPAVMALSSERDPAWTDRPDEVLAIVEA